MAPVPYNRALPAHKRAAAQGRVWNGKVYASYAAARLAQSSASKAAAGSAVGPVSSSSPVVRGVGAGVVGARSGGSVGIPNETAGWVASVVELPVRCSLGEASGTSVWSLLGSLENVNTFVTGVSDCTDVKIQGLRVEVKFPFSTEKFRWAAAFVTSYSGGTKTPSAVMGLSGANGSHDPSAPEAWFTVRLSGLPALKKSDQTAAAAPVLGLILSWENKILFGSAAAEAVEFVFHITVLKPSDASTKKHSI